MRRYELWDTETGNRVGSFRSREDALAEVRSNINLNGVDSIATLSLGLIVWGDGIAEKIAEGRELVTLAYLVD